MGVRFAFQDTSSKMEAIRFDYSLLYDRETPAGGNADCPGG
jgi:hypothetical protein